MKKRITISVKNKDYGYLPVISCNKSEVEKILRLCASVDFYPVKHITHDNGYEEYFLSN